MPKPQSTLPIVLFLAIATLPFLTNSQGVKLKPPILQQQIGQSIFHDNKLYMILVTDDSVPHDNITIIFNQYCDDNDNGNVERLCTVLSPQVDRYHDFKQFIGARYSVFFAILDVNRRKKYVLPYLKGMTANDIRIFQSKFQQGILQPFYNSQQPDAKPYQKCQKLVSKTLTNFLDSNYEIKVIFLYTQHEACQVCGEMLRQFADLAEKLYEKEIVVFGYFDIFRNDHPRITDQILPYFLIFSGKQEPYGLPAEKFHELQETIIQIALKDTDINLDKFRSEYTLRFDKDGNKIKPEKEFEIDYNIGENGEILKNKINTQIHGSQEL